MLAALLVIAAVVGFIVLGRLVRVFADQPSEAQCASLLDRYVDHASRQHHPGVDDDDIQRAVEQSQGKAERFDDLASCRDELTARQVECALSSTNVDEMERCVQ